MYLKKQTICTAGLCVALLLSFCAAAVQAETVAHWRFEDSPGFLEDSGSNNMDLTIYDGDSNSANDPTQYTLPETGAGAYFPNPIPQTGATNLEGVTIIHNHDGLTGLDNGALSFTTGFTIEAFFNRDTLTDHRTVYMQGYTSGSTDRNINVELRKEKRIRLSLSSDGSALTTVYSDYNVYDDDYDYFLAVACDLSNHQVTFYLKNLTEDTALWSQTVDLGGTTAFSLHDSSANFYIGAFFGTANSTLNDVFDEIRISDVVLPESQFLINVPEPSTLALLGCGLIGLLAYAWRKRK
ncbi:MAG: PEP-CTERM sorting domain-containing protein [Pirellulales bacterium]|nr:PEP-CTERM sorting domain-containing protein [Pirellulales bacterium]